MSRALFVGIGDPQGKDGAITDAYRMSELLRTHANGNFNFDCRTLTSDQERVDRRALLDSFTNLLEAEAEMVIFYYAGHGSINDDVSFINTEDATEEDQGVSLDRLINMVNKNTKVKQVLMILDCCYAGAAGNDPVFANETATLRKGLSILASSQSFETSKYEDSKGVFTSVLEAGLKGEAADPLGHVTIASLYNYADKLLGSWEQRPLLKTHTSRLRPVRKCVPALEKSEIRGLTSLFPSPDQEFQLDSSYCGSSEDSKPENVKVFRKLQKLCRNSLVIAVDEEHMYYAAMEAKSCKLTFTGKMYWRMAKKGHL